MLLRICLTCVICLAGVTAGASLARSETQRGVRRSVPPQQPTVRSTPSATPIPAATLIPEPFPVDNETADPKAAQQVEQQEVESLKTDTNLVTVPVIAATRDGNYIPDLREEEFNISEDGQKQQIAFFATVSAPFHVVLLLDTSASTEEKLSSIKSAAAAFVEQLQSGDRVKVISFDTELRELSDFTNDRAVLRKAIYKTTSGQGTRLYDAFELALASIRTVRGRKAIVIFTDGVDYHSAQATFEGSLQGLDEEGVIVYPIRYETRAETERIAREAMEAPASQLPTIGVIRKTPPPGTTAPTFPSDDPDAVPTAGHPGTTGPLGLPSPAEILRRRRQRDPDDNGYPSSNRLPPARGPLPQPDPRSDPRDPQSIPSDDRGATWPSRRGNSRADDSIDLMLDQLYLTADSYLLQLANKSGGRLLRADTLGSLPDAFAKIAAELRTQYAIGYYPVNKTRDGQYRNIKVSTTRKNVVLRARPGYRAPRGG
ncbi:MAG: VWA domain-containing protein [Acidobacteriota bacterium]